MTKRVKRPPRDRRRRFPELMDRIADGLFLVDATGNFIDVNQAACESLRYTRRELLSLSVADIAEEAASKLAEAFDGVAQAEPVIVDGTHVRKDGTTFPVQVNFSVIEFDGDRCLLAVARDMSTTVHAEEKLRDSEERLRNIFRTGFEALVIHDKGMILDVNPAFERMFGYPLSDLVGRSGLDLAAPESHDLIIDRLGSPLGEPIEAVGLRKDGARFSIEAAGREHVYEGRPVRATAVRDITERKRAEQALRESEKRFRSIAEDAPVSLLISNASDGTIVYANEVSGAVFGSSPDALRGRDVRDLFADTAESRAIRDELQQRGVVRGRRARVRRDDGTSGWVIGSIVRVSYESENVHIAAFHDTTEQEKVEEARRESEERLRSIFEAGFEGIVIHNAGNGMILDANPAFERMFGYTLSELAGKSVLDLVAPESRDLVIGRLRAPLLGESLEAVGLRKDGTRLSIEILGGEHVYEGRAVRAAAVRDITERKRAEEALRGSEEKFRLLAENAVDIIYRYRLGPNPGYEYMSPAVTATTGYAPREFYADPDLDIKIVHPDDLGALEQLIAQGLPGTQALRWLHKDGSIVWMELTYVPIFSDDGTRVALEGVARNITKRKKAEATIEHMAYHDSLTNLPNRALLEDHLELAIAQARRSGRKVAAMFLDLDRFKVINDTLGHPSGDKLLKRIAEQLTRVVRDGDTVARVGGDEFILLLPDLVDPDDARVVAERALQRIKRKRRLDGRDLVVTASLGISVYPSDGDDAETLLRHADTAMYKAKDQGRSRYEFYDASMGAAVSEQLRLESDLRRALAQDEFVLHYQPQIAIDSGEIVGIEALIRWQHPERGLLLPNEFIGQAQDSGLMSRLDERTLRAASAQCVAWQRAHSHSLRLAVNFETNALLDRGLPRMVDNILKSSGLAPASLVVEITEQNAVEDLPSTQAALRELKTLGMQIAVDDFGTGHSSLAYLSQFPVDIVKIDRVFVGGIGRTPEDSAIVRAIVSMARGLGLKVIAEGVETEEQFAFLKTLRCDEFQGHLFSKPVPPQEFEKLL